MRNFPGVVLSFFCVTFSVFAEEQYAQRHLLKRKIYFVQKNGYVDSADYWAINMGNFDFNIKREIPGERTVSELGAANLSFISSGYIEGAGFSSRGKITVEGDFCIHNGDSLKVITLEEVDTYFNSGRKVKLKNGEIHDLFIMIVNESNKVQVKRLSLMKYGFDKVWNILKLDKEFNDLVGFSFTKEGAQRAYKLWQEKK